jgi:hypothetical protein
MEIGAGAVVSADMSPSSVFQDLDLINLFIGFENDRWSIMQKIKTMGRYAATPTIDPGPKTIARTGDINNHIGR